jgi:multicomponent Na+:H+ antiporter subunit D
MLRRTPCDVRALSGRGSAPVRVTSADPPELRSTNLDADWFYRKLGPVLVGVAMTAGSAIGARVDAAKRWALGLVYRQVYRLHGPGGLLARTWNTGAIALLAVLGLWGFLLLYFWSR